MPADASMQTSNKLSWANNLRAVATFGIILLHVATAVDKNFTQIPISQWWAGNFFDGIARWCVPIFVMLTGTFALANYKGGLQNFFYKLFKRILLPFIFWTIVYLSFYHGKDLTGIELSLHQKFSLIAHELIVGTGVHLWFVYMIFGLYLLIPFVSKWVTYCTREELLLFLLLWFFFLTVDPYISHLDINLDYSYFAGFLGYMILGNYLYTLKKKPNNWLIAAIALSSYFFTIIGTYIISKRENDMNEYFFESLKPNIIIMSLCVYLLFKNIRISIPQAFQKRIDIICEHSYGIFLAHILVLTILNKCGLDYPVFTAWLSIPLITILCFIISYALVYLLKQIPYLKSLIG